MTTWIAEIGSNHNGDYSRACALIDTAAAIGCTGIKLQLYRVDRLFAPEALVANPTLAEKPFLPTDWLEPLIARAHACGLIVGVTPFDLGSVDVLSRQQIDFVKVASYSILHVDLLRAVAALGKPVVVGTGMATDSEILNAASWLRDVARRTWLHCVSCYPAPPAVCDLARMTHLRRLLGPRDHHIGWSDHSGSPAVMLRAAHRYSASMIEAHVDLGDNAGAENAGGHCWAPEDLSDVIQMIALGEDADGHHMTRRADAEERDWRADPSDGLRPLLYARAKLYTPDRN